MHILPKFEYIYILLLQFVYFHTISNLFGIFMNFLDNASQLSSFRIQILPFSLQPSNFFNCWNILEGLTSLAWFHFYQISLNLLFESYTETYQQPLKLTFLPNLKIYRRIKLNQTYYKNPKIIEETHHPNIARLCLIC